jgi:hypothetical protein
MYEQSVNRPTCLQRASHEDLHAKVGDDAISDDESFVWKRLSFACLVTPKPTGRKSGGHGQMSCCAGASTFTQEVLSPRQHGTVDNDPFSFFCVERDWDPMVKNEQTYPGTGTASHSKKDPRWLMRSKSCRRIADDQESESNTLSRLTARKI